MTEHHLENACHVVPVLLAIIVKDAQEQTKASALSVLFANQAFFLPVPGSVPTHLPAKNVLAAPFLDIIGRIVEIRARVFVSSAHHVHLDTTGTSVQVFLKGPVSCVLVAHQVSIQAVLNRCIVCRVQPS